MGTSVSAVICTKEKKKKVNLEQVEFAESEKAQIEKPKITQEEWKEISQQSKEIRFKHMHMKQMRQLDKAVWISWIWNYQVIDIKNQTQFLRIWKLAFMNFFFFRQKIASLSICRQWNHNGQIYFPGPSLKWLQYWDNFFNNFFLFSFPTYSSTYCLGILVLLGFKVRF